ncbi:MAG: O-antigen ligase family protein [Candidatus Omnitrophota bacterium]
MQGFPLVNIITILNLLLVFMGFSAKKLSIPRAPENTLMLGFFFAILMSHVANTYLGGLILSFQEFGKILIFYFLIIIILDSVNKIKIVSWLIVLSSVYMAINGIIQFYGGSGIPGTAPINDHGVMRIIGLGIFSDPNDLALLFIFTFPLVLAFIFEGRGFFHATMAIVCGISIVWALWLTNSRGGLLAFIVATIMFFRLRFKGMKWVIFAMLAVVIAVAFLPSRLTAGFFDKSSYERVIYWGYGNWAFKSHPIFGVGYNMLWQYAADKAAHNSFIQCYAELGIFGYLFWIGLIYIILYGLWKLSLYYKSKAYYKSDLFLLGEAISAAFFGYLTISLFLSRTYIVPFFVFIALAVKVRFVATQGKFLGGDLLPAYQNRRILAIGVLSILFMYIMTRFLLTRF